MISLRSGGGGTFSPYKFAVIADTHTAYDYLKDAVSKINSLEEVSFVILLGDMTDRGRQKEFLWASKFLKNLKPPLFTVIGNHDALSTGVQTYKKMFGELNYSFEFKECEFIFLNSNVWEFNSEAPDLDWLDQELKKSENTIYRFVFSHIPPFSDEFSIQTENRYRELMKYHDVTLSTHGHMHEFYSDEYYSDGIPYLLADNIEDRNFLIVSVDEDGHEINQVKF